MALVRVSLGKGKERAGNVAARPAGALGGKDPRTEWRAGYVALARPSSGQGDGIELACLQIHRSAHHSVENKRPLPVVLNAHVPGDNVLRLVGGVGEYDPQSGHLVCELELESFAFGRYARGGKPGQLRLPRKHSVRAVGELWYRKRLAVESVESRPPEIPGSVDPVLQAKPLELEALQVLSRVDAVGCFAVRLREVLSVRAGGRVVVEPSSPVAQRRHDTTRYLYHVGAIPCGKVKDVIADCSYHI